MASEADGLLLSTISQLEGSQIPPGTESLEELRPEHIYSAAANCINIIRQDSNYTPFPTNLPDVPSARFKQCANLADQLADLGFPVDIGFGAFLYPNEADTRRILLFLYEKLPRVETTAEDETSRDTKLTARMRASVASWMLQPWLPLAWQSICTTPSSKISALRRGLRTARLAQLAQQDIFTSDMVQAYHGVRFPHADHSVSPVYEFEESGISNSCLGRFAFFEQKDSAPTVSVPEPAAELEEAKTESAVERAERLETHRLQIMRKSLEEAIAKRDAAIQRRAAALAEEGALRAQIEAVKRDFAEKVADCETILRQQRASEKLLSMAANPERSRQELECALAAVAEKDETLRTAWEETRKPLVIELDAAITRDRISRESMSQNIAAVKNLRAEARNLNAQLSAREEEEKKLNSFVQAMAPVPGRSTYTNRIHEIVKNVRKQDVEIGRVIADIRKAQKSINTSTDLVRRVYGETDEFIFRAAREDEAAKKCYPLLSALHAAFEELDTIICSRGHVSNACRTLQLKIDSLTARGDAAAVEQIASDLRKLRSEKS